MLIGIAGCLDRGRFADVDTDVASNEFEGRVDVSIHDVDASETADGGERVWAPVTITNVDDETLVAQVGVEFYAPGEQLLEERPPIALGRELDPGEEHTYTPNVDGHADELSRVVFRIVEREQGIPPN